MAASSAVTAGGEPREDGDDDVFYTMEKNARYQLAQSNGHSSKTKTIDRYGFIVGPNAPQSPTVKEGLPKEVSWKREKKWLEMLDNWDFWMRKQFYTVRLRCRKGIPNSLRAKAWRYLSCSTQLQNDNPNTYKLYLKQPITPKQDTEICNDLHRSFPNHDMFADDGGLGQKHLYNVLRAYTAYNPTDGFCQAHAPIVSVLLMHMPEEDAFWCLIAMLDKYLPGYYSGQLEEVETDGRCLIKLLRTVHPKLSKRMKDVGIDAPLFMVEWFMCLFSRDLPWPSVLRIWDIFFCEGVKILFRIALVLLKHSTAHLEKIPKDFYDLLGCLKIKNMPAEILQPDFLIEEAYNLPVKESDMVSAHKKVVKQKRKQQQAKEKAKS